MKEAFFYNSIRQGVECKLCPNFCILQNNMTGNCNTRICKDNKLYSLSYGNLCAIHPDPVEKKPLYHFLPGSKSLSIATSGCVLHCSNCQNHSISQTRPQKTKNHIAPGKLIAEAKKTNCKSISYTYTDPVAFYEFAYDCSVIAKKHGIKNVFISSGFINPEPLKKIAPYIDAANIDLKSFNNSTYKNINKGLLHPVLKSLKILKDYNVWIEITNLIIPGINDNLDEIKKMCEWLYSNNFENYPIHFSRFFPAYKLNKLPPTPVERLYEARQTATDAGLKYVYLGNISGNVSNTYCFNCNNMLIRRDRYFMTENNISNGKCIFCNEKIEGIW